METLGESGRDARPEVATLGQEAARGANRLRHYSHLAGVSRRQRCVVGEAFRRE